MAPIGIENEKEKETNFMLVKEIEKRIETETETEREGLEGKNPVLGTFPFRARGKKDASSLLSLRGIGRMLPLRRPQ